MSSKITYEELTHYLVYDEVTGLFINRIYAAYLVKGERVGYRRDKIGLKWIAQVTCNKQTHHLGTFIDILEAEKAVKLKIEELHKDLQITALED